MARTNYTEEQWLAKIDEATDLEAIKQLAIETKANDNEGFSLKEYHAVQTLCDKFKEIIPEKTDLADLTEINLIRNDCEGFYDFTDCDQDDEISEALAIQLKTIVSETTDMAALTALETLVDDVDDDDLTEAYNNKITGAK
jgi:hypothetical protein